MRQIIFTNHAIERLKERENRFTSIDDLKRLASIAYDAEDVDDNLAPRLSRKLRKHSVPRNSLAKTAGGYIFIFTRSEPVLITAYQA